MRHTPFYPLHIKVIRGDVAPTHSPILSLTFSSRECHMGVYKDDTKKGCQHNVFFLSVDEVIVPYKIHINTIKKFWVQIRIKCPIHQYQHYWLTEPYKHHNDICWQKLVISKLTWVILISVTHVMQTLEAFWEIIIVYRLMIFLILVGEYLICLVNFQWFGFWSWLYMALLISISLSTDEICILILPYEISMVHLWFVSALMDLLNM